MSERRQGPPPRGVMVPGAAKGAGKSFVRLLSYMKRYWMQLILVFVCILVSAVAGVAGSTFLQTLIDDYISPMLLNGSRDFSGLAGALAKLGVLYAAGILGTLFYNRLMVVVAQGILKTIRDEMFVHMQTLPIRFFDTHASGDVMSLYTNDTDTLRQMLAQSIPQIFSSIVTVIAVFVAMVRLSIWLTLFVLAFVALMMLVTRFVGGKSGAFFVKQQNSIGAVNGYIEEMIEGQKVIKVFNHEPEAVRRFTGLNGEYRDAATAAQAYAGMMMPAMGNLSKINYAVTCCVGGLLAIGGVFDVGSLGAYLLYVKQVSQPVAQISQQLNMLLSAAAGAERIFAVMDTPAETDEGKTVIVRVEKSGDTLTETSQRTGHWAWKKPDGTLVELRGDVRLNHVTFSYDGEKTVLRDVSLFAKPGQKIAFVGSTGAGKTTITNLINRFYDVQEGTITYDGIDVKDIAKDSLRRSLGMVLQDTHLFTGTVADNIRYGKLDATDEEVRAAAKLANADAFIRHLPQGYDTVITGDGGSLSQGERQLLAIARAAVSDPPVLILDEATSSIDTRTETLIERGMDSLMEGRTVFVIAHRLSTVRNSQAILVLEHGQIIERGDHAGLLAQHGKYYQLYTGAAELS